MTAIKNLSNPELLENTRQAVSRERAQTARVLELLEEVSRRMLFAEIGFPSLFAFCVKELGYSEDQAAARISAMRLARELPETIKPAIEDGRLSLTNLAQVQTFLRHEKKAGKPYTRQAKEELVLQMQGLSKRECERKLSALAPEHARIESLRALSETETRLSIVLDAQALDDLERLRALWGNQDLGYAELIAKLARIALEKIDANGKKAREKRAEGSLESAEAALADIKSKSSSALADRASVSFANVARDNSTAAGPAQVSSPLKHSRFIPAGVKAEVWNRDAGRCTYSDPESGHRCGTTYALQYDHIIPFGQGGKTSVANLRIRCRIHNRLHAVQAYGTKKMETACGASISANHSID